MDAAARASVGDWQLSCRLRRERCRGESRWDDACGQHKSGCWDAGDAIGATPALAHALGCTHDRQDIRRRYPGVVRLRALFAYLAITQAGAVQSGRLLYGDLRAA